MCSVGVFILIGRGAMKSFADWWDEVIGVVVLCLGKSGKTPGVVIRKPCS